MNKLRKKFISPHLILLLILLSIFALESYFLYHQVYTNLTETDTEKIITSDLVRLDYASYEKTVDLIDGRKNFNASNWTLNNINPFKAGSSNP